MQKLADTGTDLIVSAPSGTKEKQLDILVGVAVLAIVHSFNPLFQWVLYIHPVVFISLF